MPSEVPATARGRPLSPWTGREFLLGARAVDVLSRELTVVEDPATSAQGPRPRQGTSLSSPCTSLRCWAPWAHLPQSSRSEKGGGPRMPPPPCPGDQAGVGTQIPPPGWSSDQPPTPGSFSSPPPAIPASLLQLSGWESVGIAQGNPSSLSVSAQSGTDGETEAQGK